MRLILSYEMSDKLLNDLLARTKSGNADCGLSQCNPEIVPEIEKTIKCE